MFYTVEQKKPPLCKYVLVARDNFITISNWCGDMWDIHPESKVPWFYKHERKIENVQPTHWMEMPEVRYG